MNKNEAITLLGGTPSKAAQALGYRSPHAVYVWPEVLPLSMADRVRGAYQRLQETTAAPRKRKQAEHATQGA